jgi:hypothetical protein
VVGSEDSTGNGERKETNGKSGVNWTTVLLGCIIFVAGYCITPFWVNYQHGAITHSDSSVVATHGRPDTTYNQGQTTQGIVTGQFHIHENDSLRNDQATIAYQPVETKVDTILKQGTEAHIRATTWVEGKDVSNIAQSIEWNIKERPCEVITQVDTFTITKTIVPELSIFQKPEVVIPSTALLTLIIAAVLNALGH